MSRPYRFAGADCFIRLNDGSDVVIDAEDAHLVVGWSWSFWPTSGTVRRLVQIKGQRSAVHIADVINPLAPGFINDHRDGDGRNNRRSNLRPATRSQNAMNRRSNRGKDGFKGVSRSNAGRYGRFRARIAVGGKTTVIGTFGSAEEAARAYDDKARELHGEFACVNFPNNNERQA